MVPEYVHAMRICLSGCTFEGNEAASFRAGRAFIEARHVTSVDHFNASAHSLSGTRDCRCNIMGEDVPVEYTGVVEESVVKGTGAEADECVSDYMKNYDPECKEPTNSSGK